MSLDRAYRDAIYRLDTAPPHFVRIGLAQPELARLHLQYQCRESLIITACNPRSRRLRPTANMRRTQALERLLGALGYHWLPTMGLDPLECWPDEPGFWIPGISLACGLGLARRFGQHAIVWCPENTVAELMWVPAMSRRTRGRSATIC